MTSKKRAANQQLHIKQQLIAAALTNLATFYPINCTLILSLFILELLGMTAHIAMLLNIAIKTMARNHFQVSECCNVEVIAW
jgi:hypothetical protein